MEQRIRELETELVGFSHIALLLRIIDKKGSSTFLSIFRPVLTKPKPRPWKEASANCRRWNSASGNWRRISLFYFTYCIIVTYIYKKGSSTYLSAFRPVLMRQRPRPWKEASASCRRWNSASGNWRRSSMVSSEGTRTQPRACANKYAMLQLFCIIREWAT